MKDWSEHHCAILPLLNRYRDHANAGDWQQAQHAAEAICHHAIGLEMYADNAQRPRESVREAEERAGAPMVMPAPGTLPGEWTSEQIAYAFAHPSTVTHDDLERFKAAGNSGPSWSE